MEFSRSYTPVREREIDYSQHLYENELEIAWAQARADIAAGHYVIESAENHVKKLIEEYHLSTS
jgi:hypothetical protein